MKAEKYIASNTTLAKILKVEPHTAQSGFERLEERHLHAQRRTALGGRNRLANLQQFLQQSTGRIFVSFENRPPTPPTLLISSAPRRWAN
jgi:hypothetical protein